MFRNLEDAMYSEITGKKELCNLKIKWTLAGPNAGSGNCCASGSHDDSPITCQNKASSQNAKKIIPMLFDLSDAFRIKALYGSIRK